ncbi:MAG TPA: Ig-like domain-containing protein, partial [Anaerolineales bacterium]|nr:Ig-like domain-containing protein [Anaerolineales bacterium]
MTKFRFALTLNCFILISLIVSSCSGVPTLPNIIAPTPTAETEAEALSIVQQAYPVALIETDPPFDTMIGHQSPITFYFNQGMNKPSVESALSGLPDGTFTWTDEATLTFTPVQPYQPDTKLNIEIANSIQSASGFGISEPIQLSFTVADYLRATNLLPKENTTDVNVDAAIVASFNQPVVPLGAEASSLP